MINVVEHEMNKGENIVAGSRLEREGVLMLVDVSGKSCTRLFFFPENASLFALFL